VRPPTRPVIPVPCPLLSHAQHDFAEVQVRFHVPMGVRRVGERELAVDDRAQDAAAEERQRMGDERLRQGDLRFDRFYSLSGELIYKMDRNFWVTGTLRRDWLDSNIPGNSTNATIVMLGVRLQN